MAVRVRLDPLVRRGGRPIELTAAEFSLLRYFRALYRADTSRARATGGATFRISFPRNGGTPDD